MVHSLFRLSCNQIFLVPRASQIMYKLPYNVRPVMGNHVHARFKNIKIAI